MPRPNFRQGGGQSNPAKEGVEKCEGSGLIIPVRSSAKRPDPEKSKETRGQGNPAKAGRAAYSAEVLSIFDRTKDGCVSVVIIFFNSPLDCLLKMRGQGKPSPYNAPVNAWCNSDFFNSSSAAIFCW